MVTKPRRKRRRYKHKSSVSKFQRRVAGLFRIALGDSYLRYEVNWRWLKNHDGNALYVDIFFPRFNLAIEAHGIQHYKWPNYFHKTYEEFQHQQENDEEKRALLQSHGITLISIPYDPVPTPELIGKLLVMAKITKPDIKQANHNDYSDIATRRSAATTGRVMKRTPAPS